MPTSASAVTVTCGTEEIQNAKQHLRDVLAANYFNTKNEEVAEAVESLSKLWKSDANATIPAAPAKSDLILGDWRILSAPDFPDRIVTEGEPNKFQYTLGRVAFNIFEPKKAIVTMLHPTIVNSVHRYNNEQKEEDGQKEQEEGKATYNIVNKIIIHTENGDLPAELYLEGYCYPTPQNDERLTVGFTGGTLRKSAKEDADYAKDEKLQTLWEDTFGNIYSKADKERGYLDSVMRWMMKFMLKMTMPTDESMSYEMKRVMHGYLDCLFLDEEMRITRGNRGSVVIMEK